MKLIRSLIFLLFICNAIRETSQCTKAWNYYVDEAKNRGGSNRCTSSCECDGLRSCSYARWCSGTSRVTCLSYQVNINNVCRNSCPQGYYQTSNTCALCDSTCSTCSGASSTSCQSCQQNRYLLNGQCLSTCPSGYVAQSNKCILGCVKSQEYTLDESKNALGSNRCNKDCDCDGLRTCSNAGWCQGVSRTSCSGNLFFLNSQCLSACPAGYVGVSNKCLQCDSSCLTCSNTGSTSCVTCVGSLNLYNGQCLSSCPSGYVAQDGKCTGCEKSQQYIVDESKNVLGSNQCSKDCDCDGLRTCSGAGWCQGVSRN